jgi:hypothetical protein
MVLVLTQPLTEMSARKLPGDKAWPAGKADNLSVTRIVLPLYLLGFPCKQAVLHNNSDVCVLFFTDWNQQFVGFHWR